VLQVLSSFVDNILPHLWETSYAIGTPTSVDGLHGPPYSADDALPGQEMFTPQRFFDFGEQVKVTWTHVRGIGCMSQYLPSPAAEKAPDNGSGVTPRTDVPLHDIRILSTD
jgi:hypothetical protein